MRNALLGLGMLAALLWWERGQRPHRTSVRTFKDMVGLEDCASTYLDDGLMRPA